MNEYKKNKWWRDLYADMRYEKNEKGWMNKYPVRFYLLCEKCGDEKDEITKIYVDTLKDNDKYPRCGYDGRSSVETQKVRFLIGHTSLECNRCPLDGDCDIVTKKVG